MDIIITQWGDAYLCGAYVKSDAKKEKRMMARFEVHATLIRQGNYIHHGTLS